MKHTSEEIKYRLSDLGVQIGNIAIEYIAELEKENAELKHTTATLRQEKDNVSMHAKAMEVVAKTRSEQLTNAKEIIREFVEWATWQGSNCPNFKSIQDKAEQFLIEVEK